MKTVIMAGGKGTRISSVAADIPKPMIRVAGKPVLEHEIDELKVQEFTDLIIMIGHLGNKIKEYFGDGSRFGVRITYLEEKVPLGTAGGLYYLKDILDEDFLLLNGDLMLSVDFHRLVEFHKKCRAEATILTHPNDHPYDSGLIFTEWESGRVTAWINKEEPRKIYKNRVNAGVHVLSPRLLQLIQRPEKIDLDRQILKPLVKGGGVYAYDSPEYVKDMGTPERYEQVCRDYRNGIVKGKSLRTKQKAIFLDRDGTINQYRGFITQSEQIELLPGVAQAIRQINASGYLAVVVTNQPIIARGDCTIEQLNEIHDTLETYLGEHGAYVDAIYYCPHHPHRGFEGERIEYKVDCECRKPKPGLLFTAAKDLNISLAESFMIGDSELDIQAGENAGCKKSILIAPESKEISGRVYPSLLQAVDSILFNNES